MIGLAKFLRKLKLKLNVLSFIIAAIPNVKFRYFKEGTKDVSRQCYG